MQRVFEHLADNDKTTKGPLGDVFQINVDKWDADVLTDFSLMINKMTNRLVQENYYGTQWSIPLTNKFINESPALKLLFQFRNFAFGAITQQTLQGMSQRDMTIAFRLSLQLCFGALSYMLMQKYLNSNSENIEERLSPKAIGTAAIQRSGFFSIIPATIDTAATTLSGGSIKPIFAHGRTSGMSVAPPAVSDMANAMSFLTGSANAALRGDYDFSQTQGKALKRLLPLSLIPGSTQAIDSWVKTLPKKSYKERSDILDNLFSNE